MNTGGDTSFALDAWQSIDGAFAALSKRYRPTLIQVLWLGDGLFDVHRRRAGVASEEVGQRLDIAGAIQFITARIADPAQLEGYSIAMAAPRANPVRALLLAAQVPSDNWGTFVLQDENSETHLSIPREMSDSGSPPEGWHGIGSRLGHVSIYLMHQVLLFDKLNSYLSSAIGRITPSELLRRAAAESLATELTASGIDNPEDSAGGKVFLRIDNLSKMSYERREICGRLVFRKVSGQGAEGVAALDVRFATPVALESARAARKILEMTTMDLAAISEDGINIHGITRVPRDAPDRSLDVTFLGQHAWSASCGRRRPQYRSRPLFQVRNGVPVPSVGLLTKVGFERWLTDQLPLALAALDRLWILVDAALHANHGALIVLSDRAAAEVRRLGPGSLQLQYVEHEDAVLCGLCAIDGAVLADLGGQCLAAGVILDGLALKSDSTVLKESSARGARFNSATRYVARQRADGGQVGAIVISEDRSVDLLPASVA